MQVRKAIISDIPGIDELLQSYSLDKLDPSFINHRDISIVAVSEEGKIIGFVFCGLMAKGTLGYIDAFTIDKNLSKTGIGKEMSKFFLIEAKHKRVKKLVGMIAKREYHDSCLYNAHQLGMNAFISPFTAIIGVL